MASLLVLLLIFVAAPGAAQISAWRGEQPFQLSNLEQILRSNPDAKARIRAAELLAQSGGPEVAGVLQGALPSEKDQGVLKSILRGLERMGAPLSLAPETCLEIISRCGDVTVAKPLFDRWRASATLANIVNAGSTGPAVLRALALHSLAELRVGLDAVTQERLLNATVQLLSQDTAMADSTNRMMVDAVWDLSQHDMATVLKHVDRVSSGAARYRLSYAFSLRQPEAYNSYRRPRQFQMALIIGICLALFLAVKRFRRPATLLLMSILGWGFWSLISKDFRQLPPLPFPLFTASFLAFLAAGIAVLLVGLIPWRKVISRDLWRYEQVGLAATIAGTAAGVACFATRITGLLPVLSGGLDLLVEPFGSFMLGLLAGGLFALFDSLIFRAAKLRS
jgi:hypothetical protein